MHAGNRFSSVYALLSSPTFREWRARLDTFFRWWGAELWASLPERWRQRLRVRERPLLLTFEEESARVVVVDRNLAGSRRAFSLAPRDEEEGKALAEIQRAIQQHGARLDVVVPEAHIIRRQMILPQAAQGDLKSTLAAELERSQGFKLDEIYFDGRIAGSDLGAQTITVDAAIVPRRPLDGIVSALREAGLNPGTVCTWKDGAKRADATFLTWNTGRSARAGRMVTSGLVVLVLAFDAAAAYVPLWVKINVLSDLQRRIEVIKPNTAEALQLEQTLNALHARQAHLIALKRQAPSMAEIVAELARVLPDSAWLDQLQVRDGRIQFAGFAAETAGLLSAIDESSLLSDVRTEWPIAAAAPDSDRFDISARIETSSGDRR